ncbi:MULTISPECIES: Xaa-Pro peptidase family protein [unclassified Brucella]|uniref:M24 family metallopeptidase n=1 Tax=unclassified Brucella TaxID=2632610 RepID=UPI000972742C|nr:MULTISPECIES: Xaa-Pro peptidase family protein [unclassified Brucella]APX70819.1 X-Pro dipeptidase [Brucella sp. 09RB8471]MRN76906.1 M24 family metallopeptidase [Brucella sp. 10RB9210]
MAPFLSPPKIQKEERQQRLALLQGKLKDRRIGGLLLGSTPSLQYFTGLVWRSSERFLGALVTPSELIYIVPGFERSRVESLPHLSGEIRGWEEEENSAALIASLLPAGASLAVDDAIPLFAYNLLRQEIAPERLLDGGPLIREQRICKSENEIAIIQYAMNLTLEVHRRAHAMIKPGIAASEMVRFIDEQHRALGARGGSTFCIVSFGAATALPHGADGEQFYQPGDVVLVDTGCRIDGYHSDLTRTYMLDEPSKEFAQIWAIEREAQQAVFDAARLGAPCSTLDDAARAVLVRHGLGPDYKLPGLPHRAGHGLGLEIHESPYIVRANPLPLTEGMCFSNEPMIVVPEQFGVRLEDHIYMTANGPKWFTLPSKSPVEPFA